MAGVTEPGARPAAVDLLGQPLEGLAVLRSARGRAASSRRPRRAARRRRRLDDPPTHTGTAGGPAAAGSGDPRSRMSSPAAGSVPGGPRPPQLDDAGVQLPAAGVVVDAGLFVLAGVAADARRRG